MKLILNILPIALYLVVGAISMVMAYKNIFAKRFLPFHEQAAGKPWDEIEKPLQRVILSLLKLTGLGFLIISLLLIVCPIVNYFSPNIFYKYAVPTLVLIYCSGLFIINFRLCRDTKAATPWKGSLYACLALLVGIIISLFT